MRTFLAQECWSTSQTLQRPVHQRALLRGGNHRSRTMPSRSILTGRRGARQGLLPPVRSWRIPAPRRPNGLPHLPRGLLLARCWPRLLRPMPARRLLRGGGRRHSLGLGGLQSGHIQPRQRKGRARPRSACLACPMGTYSPRPGAVSNATCEPCRAGTFAGDVGLDASELCESAATTALRKVHSESSFCAKSHTGGFSVYVALTYFGTTPAGCKAWPRRAPTRLRRVHGLRGCATSSWRQARNGGGP